MSKISVKEFIDNENLLEVVYVPFDRKMEIVGYVLRGLTKALGGINSSMLRRVSTEVFIENITNLDLNIEDENELKGFDQLCFHGKLDDLIVYMGNEYIEMKRILDEYVADYIRTETNPAVTINAIYDQMKMYMKTALDYIHEYIKDIDVEQLGNTIAQLVGQGSETK